MRILALDLGTKCGWALQVDKRKPKYGTLDLSKRMHFDGGGMQYIQFEKWLHEQLPLDLIVYEAVLKHDPRQVHAQHRYGAFMGTLQQFGEKHNIPHAGENVATLKKFWTGNGAAKKQAMIDEARERGFNPANDNEADALGLLHMGKDLYELFL